MIISVKFFFFFSFLVAGSVWNDKNNGNKFSHCFNQFLMSASAKCMCFHCFWHREIWKKNQRNQRLPFLIECPVLADWIISIARSRWRQATDFSVFFSVYLVSINTCHTSTDVLLTILRIDQTTISSTLSAVIDRPFLCVYVAFK